MKSLAKAATSVSLYRLLSALQAQAHSTTCGRTWSGTRMMISPPLMTATPLSFAIVGLRGWRRGDEGAEMSCAHIVSVGHLSMICGILAVRGVVLAAVLWANPLTDCRVGNVPTERRLLLMPYRR